MLIRPARPKYHVRAIVVCNIYLKMHIKIDDSFKCVALFHALRIVPPPIRHANNPGTPEDQEDQQHIQVKTSVESGSQDEIVLGPQLVAVPVRPIHNDKATDESRKVACRYISVEDRAAAEEDGRVPEVEFGTGKESVEEIYDGWQGGTDEEGVRKGFELFLLEESGWPLFKQRIALALMSP